jgi:hypothetical protein
VIVGTARLILAALFVFASSAAAEERIRDFRAEIELHADGSFGVEERILYDFGDASRSGIYREIPIRYGRGRAADYRIDVEVESISDDHDEPLPYRTSHRGAYLRVWIGDPERRVTGVQEYRIRYRVRRGILWLEEHDELYWNATGTEWPVPVDRAGVTVTTPRDRPAPEPRALCFTGRRGSVESACTISHAHRTTRAEADRPFDPQEGLTVVVAMPKGLLDEPSRWRTWLDRASDYLSAASALPVLVFAGLGGLWWRTGRDPGGAVAVPVRYEPPEDMTPAEMGTVLDEQVHMADITSTLLDLAVRGYLRIDESSSKSFLFLSSSDFTLHRLRPGDEALKAHEQKLLEGLFDGGDEVRVSDLRNRFYKHLPAIRTALYSQVSKEGGWFPTSPDTVRKRYAGVSLGLAIPAGIAAMHFDRPSLAVSVAACALAGVFWSRFLPRATRAGRRAKQHIRGFQEFVERVEADRLERLGLRDVAQFERLLPYAFVLGVADNWAEAFADLYTEPPSWYRSRDGGAFRPRRFVSDVGRSLDTVGSALRSQPRGSGSSGFRSGGGFSGGGFGGGGGGSW